MLLNVNNGDIISLVSLPNFNINQREKIEDKKYINKITKGVYELGSIFKTFTVALAIENNIVNKDTVIKNIPNKLRCSIHEITDMKKHPNNLSTEDILVRSSNVGSVLLAQKIGEDIFKEFIKNTNLIKSPKIELEEVGSPHELKWNKCKIETISFGHGITTTPLVMLENPKLNRDLVYNFRGVKTKAPYNTSGWNSVYIAGKIIEKIGPILAINNEEFLKQYVVEKFN